LAPPYLAVGANIIVPTADGSYLERGAGAVLNGQGLR
jgi:hypothetical protein